MDFEKYGLTSEMAEKVKQAKSAEEVLKLAEEYGVSVTEEEAKQVMLFLANGELSDDELDAVSGGKGRPNPVYAVGQRVLAFYSNEEGYIPGTVAAEKYVEKQGAWYYTIKWDKGDERNMTAQWIKPL